MLFHNNKRQLIFTEKIKNKNLFIVSILMYIIWENNFTEIHLYFIKVQN